MAHFEIVEGRPGQGKSAYTARMVKRLLIRNKKWFNKTGIKREIWSNIRFSDEFEREGEGYINYWADTQQVVKLRDVDLIWDEIATELDSRNYVNLSIELKRFLSQYRKRGIDIYANTQDFSMIDRRARLMVSQVSTLTKIFGSRDISTTKPDPKHIFGFVIIRQVINYMEDEPEKKKYEWIPSFMWIDRELISIYDTRQDIALGNPPPLKHEIRVCEIHGKGCDFSKLYHS